MGPGPACGIMTYPLRTRIRPRKGELVILETFAIGLRPGGSDPEMQWDNMDGRKSLQSALSCLNNHIAPAYSHIAPALCATALLHITSTPVAALIILLPLVVIVAD